MSDGRGKLHALVPSTGKEQNILSQQDTRYTQIGAIPHSSLLIAIREDGGFDLVDPLQNTVIHKETVTTPILYLTTSSSGKEIAFVDQKGLVKVLDVTQLSVKYQFTMKGAFLSAKSLAFSGDGSFLVARSNQKWYTIDLAHQSRKEQDRPYGNGSLLLYEDLIYLPVSTTRGWNFERINIKTLQKKDTWKSKGLVISDMAVNPKNGDLLVAWGDHKVSFITAQEEKKIVSSKETVSSLSFLKDGSYALMSSIDGKMQVIRYQPLREEQKIEGVPLAQSPDLSMLLLEPERTENAKRFNALYHQTLSRLLHTEETRTPEQLWNDLSTLKKESSLEQSLHRGVKERILLSQQDVVPGKKTQGIPAAPAKSGPGGDPPTD